MSVLVTVSLCSHVGANNPFLGLLLFAAVACCLNPPEIHFHKLSRAVSLGKTAFRPLSLSLARRCSPLRGAQYHHHYYYHHPSCRPSPLPTPWRPSPRPVRLPWRVAVVPGSRKHATSSEPAVGSPVLPYAVLPETLPHWAGRSVAKNTRVEARRLREASRRACIASLTGSPARRNPAG